MIRDYLESNQHFGMNIAISFEEVLLDTGGGLKQAAYFFLDGSEEPFLLHNVDVISTIDLRRMVEFHSEHQALATLAVRDRKTSRYLLFEEGSELCGRRSGQDQTTELVRPAERVQALAFGGIHVISPRFLTLMSEEGAFSIITSYLRLAARGEKILGFRTDSVAQATEDLLQQEILP
jgi:NDP-sugar pyrophosphorylase family protein